jgi:prepilin peptidase CpaA
MWNLVIIAFAVTAAVADVWRRKIPPTLTISGFIAGLAFHAFHGDFLSALATAGLGFAIGLALFSLGAIGGGDVKLITALGAMMGFSTWALAMEVSIFVAAGMAIIQVVRHHAVRETLHNTGAILSGLFHSGLRAHPVVNVANANMIRSPYGLAAAIGTVVAVIKI